MIMMNRYAEMLKRRNALQNDLRKSSSVDLSGDTPKPIYSQKLFEEFKLLEKNLKDIEERISKIDDKIADQFDISCVSEYIYLKGYIKQLELALDFDTQKIWKKICRNFKADYVKFEGDIAKMIQGTERFKRQQDLIDELQMKYDLFDEVGVRELSKALCGKWTITEEIKIEPTEEQNNLKITEADKDGSD